MRPFCAQTTKLHPAGIANSVHTRSSSWSEHLFHSRSLPLLYGQCVRPLWDGHHSCRLDILYMGCYLYLAYPHGYIHHHIRVPRVLSCEDICDGACRFKEFTLQMIVFLSVWTDPGLSVCCPAPSIFAGWSTWWWTWSGSCCGTESMSSTSATDTQQKHSVWGCENRDEC